MVRAYINYIITRIKDALVGPFTETQGDKDHDRLYQEELERQLRDQKEDAALLSELQEGYALKNPFPVEQDPDPIMTQEEYERDHLGIRLKFPKQIPTSDDMIEERKAKREQPYFCQGKILVNSQWKPRLAGKVASLLKGLPNGERYKSYLVTITVTEVKEVEEPFK